MKRLVVGALRAWAALWQPRRRDNERRLLGGAGTLSTIRIREAVEADTLALAALHVETWNATYRPFGMKGPGVAVRKAQWREAFAQTERDWFCFVAEQTDGQLIGFAKAQRDDHPEYAGQLSKIYVLPEYQRLGVGKRLLGAVARRFLAEGVESMWLIGDARNPSRQAWLHLGAVKTDDDPGTGNYGWRDLKALAERCPE